MLNKRYEIKQTFYRLDRKIPSVLYEPVRPDERAQIAVVIMHGTDFLTYPMMPELARHGFLALAANPSHSSYPEQMLDLQVAIAFMYQYPGVKKVVLIGHSRGASLTSAYLKIAENGARVFQGSDRILPFPDMPELTPADGYMVLDANFGIMGILGLDPSVINEGNAIETDPSLDALNPQNGYDPDGSHYTQEFKKRFFRAQVKRYKGLLDLASQRLKLIEAKKGNYYDNEPFVIASGFGGLHNSKLFSLDTSLLTHTKGAYPLIHPDGSVTTETVYSVRIAKDMKERKGMFSGAALVTTVKDFLLGEIKIDDNFGYDEDSFWGVDWSSCFTCPAGNVDGITIPLLAMGMTGSYEYIEAEFIYERAASKDKSIAFTEGAGHEFETASETEKYPGQWGDTLVTTVDYITKWLLEPGRFL